MTTDAQQRPGTFSGLAKVLEDESGETATLLEPLTYVTHDGWAITVPAGFSTDYASIPRLLWNILPPHGRYSRPSIVHDFLYRVAPIDPRTGRPCTQHRADSIIRDASADVAVRITQRWAIWLGLAAGGWLAWRRYRRRTTG